MFSNLFSITLPNIGKYFPGIHFPRNSLSKRKLLSCKQTGPIFTISLIHEEHSTRQRTFNKTKNTHIFSLYKNIIFIFFNLYPLVSWEKNSNTDLNIGVSLVSRGICFTSTTRVQISSDRES